MPKLIISMDGVVIKEVEITQERTTLGRRPYNDIVIDNLAVSGEHAVLHLHVASGIVEIEDIGSTNGTFVNGHAVKRQALRDADTLEMGKCQVRFLSDTPDESPIAATSPVLAPTPLAVPLAAQATAAATVPTGVIRVLLGAAAGREVQLTKVVTTIGKPGLAVASITRRHHGFVLSHVEGPEMPLLNGTPIGSEPVPLKNGDHLALAGTTMQFLQH